MTGDERRVYTDGACRGNPGPGGWAWAEPGGGWASGFDPATTNQRMEIMAALEAARAHDGPLVIVSDSTYVVHCWRDRWWDGWLRRGWRNSAKQPVANRDLWEQMIEHFRDRSDLRLEWVKGHSGDPMNDVVDRLAVRAAAEGRGDRGDAPPSEDQLGPADDVTRPAAGNAVGVPVDPVARDGRVPEGWRLAVVGLRSERLTASPAGVVLRRQLTEILQAQRELHPELVVLTGMRPGAEELGALAALDAGVRLAVVLPFPDPTQGWAEVDAAEFARRCDRAERVVTLEKKRPVDVAGRRAALGRRDGWLRSVCDAAIAVSDGEDTDAELVRIRFERALEDRGRGEELWSLEVPEG